MSTHHLSEAAIRDFKAAYEAEFDEKLTEEQVREIAMNLLRFFSVLTSRK